MATDEAQKYIGAVVVLVYDDGYIIHPAGQNAGKQVNATEATVVEDCSSAAVSGVRKEEESWKRLRRAVRDMAEFAAEVRR